MNNYADYLVSRIFERNGFGSTSALIEAIRKASEISETERWRDRKAAFNAIGEAAPMREYTGYVLAYHEVPRFIDAECTAYAEHIRAQDSVFDHGKAKAAELGYEVRRDPDQPDLYFFVDPDGNYSDISFPGERAAWETILAEIDCQG